MKKKIIVHEEIMYFIAMFILAFGVAMTAAADFGVSMVVAPAYILSLKVDFLSFGAGEYVVQGALFIVMCIILKGVKLKYFFSFLSCLLYGALLDLIRAIIPFLNPANFPASGYELWQRILLLCFGMIIISYSLSIAFNVYPYPQVNDYFVKAVSTKYNKKTSSFKIVYDACFLVISVAMALILFGDLTGIGIGTVAMTLFNGWLIKLFTKINGCFLEYKPLITKGKSYFEGDFSLEDKEKSKTEETKEKIL